MRTMLLAVVAAVLAAAVALPLTGEAQQARPSKSKAKAKTSTVTGQPASPPSTSATPDWRTNAFGGPGSTRGS